MFIVRYSEEVHAYLLKCCRGTCSSVGILKGYMVKEMLRTPALVSCGHQIGESAAPHPVGPEQECNFKFITNGWARLATRCGWA